MLQTILFHLQSLRTREERGQGMVEYALILALISIVAIAVLILVGGEIVNVLNDVVAGLQGAQPAP